LRVPAGAAGSPRAAEVVDTAAAMESGTAAEEGATTKAAKKMESPHPPYALVASRLAPEKGVDVAIAACRSAGIALVVAGDGPELSALRELAGDGDVRFAGRVDDVELARLRAGAAVALAPSRSAETFGMAAAEAMAAGLPVAASAVGALPELLGAESLAPPGDARALAAAIARVLADATIARRGLERVRALCAPEVVARSLAEVYAST
jgi:glycosyltransferase involved in cell wall biosynthesis